MQYLREHGIRFGESGISHTVARHRRTYYATESRRNTELLKRFRESNLLLTVE